MSKWYRISISLATKCRIGFTLAVLIIISAGLFFPYRWMGKLIEQGKHELAQQEAWHALEQHYGQPPLLESPEGNRLQFKTDFFEVTRPITQWLSLSEDQSIAKYDKFTRHGIRKFREDKSKYEYFSFHRKTPALSLPPSEGTSENIDPNAVMSVPKAMDSAQDQYPTTGYLWALRAEESCMASGCHESRPSDSITETAATVQLPRSFTEGELVGVISVVIPAGQTNTTLLFNLLTIIMGGAFSCISAAVVFYLFTQRIIIQPVRSLRQAADQVTVSSDEAVDDSDQEMKAWGNALAITENIKTGDEFEKMAKAFHQMLTRLKLAHDRLRETNRALDMRLGELETRNIALYESNKLKSEFLANVSHELRTPLNAIIGFAEILKDQAKQRNDERNIHYSNNVLESGNMLLGIINDLLELATIEAGKVEIHWESIPFEETLEAILNLTRPQFAEKNLHVITSIDESTGWIETDTGKLQQILFNLFSNAIKFTPAEGTVEISARKYVNLEQRSMLEIIVADNGKGIAEEDREKIFEKFLQLDGSVTREYTGVGLGLAIVKELTAILNGTISVGGQVGQGAIFTLTLPVARDMDE